ncbi:MAG: ligase-associated DNA damage response endonuclease PdeM [Bacteroidetes bacterium]|nr:MAG: ligase-associated DNA damage response endonuclease PdeM [Bacteroidota bacterium]
MSASPSGILDIVIQEQHWQLHPYKAAYWQETKTLLISDLHLGKSAHFRRAGIAAPKAVEGTNTDRLISLLLHFAPTRVLLLGDLFHSDYNAVWDDWCALVRQFLPIRFELVPGNHDILPAPRYAEAQLKMLPVRYAEGPFLFSHEPLAKDSSGSLYNICGHIHPAVQLQGSGRQKLRLPCFYFGRDAGIMPAFGAFTGLACIPVQAQDRVYGITDTAVLELAS